MLMKHEWTRVYDTETGQQINTWLYTNSVMVVTLTENKWNVVDLFKSDGKDPSACVAVFETLHQAKEYVERSVRDSLFCQDTFCQ